MYDLVIIGGGPGGVAAGVYAARKKIKAVLLTDTFGGQSLISAGIENWIGTKMITGYDLAKSLEDHLRAQKDIDIADGELVERIEKKDGGFVTTTKSGKSFESKYVLVTSGSHHKRLDVPGEKDFEGKGVVYCATCDAPLFEHKTVAVVGGGNSALESVIDLIPYASKIYLMVRGSALKGDPVSQDKVKGSEKVKIMFNVSVESISGKEFVTGVRYKDLKSNEVQELALDGVFVEVGLAPNSDFLNGIVTLGPFGEVIIDPKTQKTSAEGIWAAGDVTDVLYRQNNISVGDSIKAVLNIYDVLKKE